MNNLLFVAKTKKQRFLLLKNPKNKLKNPEGQMAFRVKTASVLRSEFLS